MARVCEGECMARSPGDEPLTLTRRYNCGLPQLYEAVEGWKSVSLQLKGIKGKLSVFLFFLKLCFSYTVALFLA